jgi:hypothetical protein
MKAKQFLIILCLILLCASALAETYIYLDIDPAGNADISVIESTLYYRQSLFKGFTPESGGFSIAFLDSGNTQISGGTAYPGENNLFSFDSRVASISVSQDAKLLSKKQLSFCNLNGICEPCRGPACTIIESSLSCADCPTGSSDYACDLANEGICDPDCDDKDKDCPGCTEDCWYKDSTMPTTACAADKNGEACAPGQLCTGEYVYADDTGSLCCTGGRCMDKTVVVTSVPKDNLSETPSTPAEQPPSQTQKKSPLWLIPVIAIIALALSAYFLLRKPVVDR